MYKIKDYSYKKARELSLDIKPSKKTGKKIDIYKNGHYVTSANRKYQTQRLSNICFRKW